MGEQRPEVVTEAKRERRRRRALEQQRRQAAARQRRRRTRAVAVALVALPALATVVLVVAGVVERGGARDEPGGVETVEVAGREHVEGPVDYDRTPPAGGPHAPVWQNCGAYDTPVSEEQAVHSLEHGAVWIAYRPDLRDDQVEALRSMAADGFVLVAPYEGLPNPVVASAWGRQLRVDSSDDERIAEFVRVFRQGPQTPEPGAPCTGGVGEPVG